MHEIRSAFPLAFDSAGNTRVAQLTVSVDTQHPTLAITSPAPDAKVKKGNLKVNGTATDNARVAKIEMTVNGVAVVVTGLSVWSANVTLKEGKNTINVTATDSSGLTSTVKSMTVTYTKPKKTPGFEATVLVGAVIVAMLLVSRRKRN